MKESARRVQDIVSRYGGEEFSILLPETDLAGAQVLANKISQLSATPAGSKNQPVTASLGIACVIPSHTGGSPRKLIEQADQAL
ncbi:MAG: diguanylate cyclase [Amphritea sp.]